VLTPNSSTKQLDITQHYQLVHASRRNMYHRLLILRHISLVYYYITKVS